jgi:hypothetical protein
MLSHLVCTQKYNFRPVNIMYVSYCVETVKLIVIMLRLALLLCIWEVPGSDLGPKINFPQKSFCDFPYSLETNAGIVPEISPWLLLSILSNLSSSSHSVSYSLSNWQHDIIRFATGSLFHLSQSYGKLYGHISFPCYIWGSAGDYEDCCPRCAAVHCG